jgi:hypothetical protein
MHSASRVATLLLSSGALLSACASEPKVVVSSSGALPASGSFELVADQEAGSLDILNAVAERLSGHGLRRSADAEYLVQATLSSRPGPLGVVDPDDAQPAWLRAPERRERSKRHAAQLTVNLVERATGREIYQGSAVASPSRSKPEPHRLIDAIFPAGAADQ